AGDFQLWYKIAKSIDFSGPREESSRDYLTPRGRRPYDFVGLEVRHKPLGDETAAGLTSSALRPGGACGFDENPVHYPTERSAGEGDAPRVVQLAQHRSSASCPPNLDGPNGPDGPAILQGEGALEQEHSEAPRRASKGSGTRRRPPSA